MPDDRPRGVLAPVDRAYLRGEKDYDHRQTVYDREATIRDRVENAVLDMPELIERWPDDERQKVFSDIAETLWSTERGIAQPRPGEDALGRALIDMVAFAWLAAEDRGYSPRAVVERGVSKAVERENPESKADVTLGVSLERREVTAAAAKRKLESGEDLTDVEKVALLESGDVSPDRLASYVRGGSDDR